MAEIDQPWLPAVDGIVASHAGEPGALLPILHSVQKKLGYIPAEAVERIARPILVREMNRWSAAMRARDSTITNRMTEMAEPPEISCLP